MTMPSTSPFALSWPVRFLVRLREALLGSRSPSPPPLPPPAEPSGTLADDAQSAVELSESQVVAVNHLGEVAEMVMAGDVPAFVCFTVEPGGIVWRYYRDPGADLGQLAMAIQSYGYRLQRQIARSEGNAPPQNRSEHDH